MITNEFDFCRGYLTSDEYVTWSGKPEKGNILTASDAFMIPFSIFWCGFAVFWVISATASGAGFFAFFGIPFIAIGFFLVFGRFIFKAHMRKTTFYVITNKRIIRKLGRRIDMVELKNMPPISIQMHKNGNGTITIGQPNQYTYHRKDMYYQNGYSAPFTIENISEIAKVQQLISSAE